MPVQQHTNTFTVKVAGDPLNEAVKGRLVSAYVDDSLNLPDMFQLAIRDPDRSAIEQGKFQIGSPVEISLLSDAAPGGEKLFTGEVTALEAEFDPEGTMTLVRGFDKSHRLHRGRRTESYLNMTYSDIARKVAQRAGLTVGTVDPSPTVHPHVSQANLSDFTFLKGLANEIGFDMAVVDGKFEFRKPPQSSAGPGQGDLQGDDPLELTLGSTLLRFRASVTSADQVSQVKVRGWDVKAKKHLEAKADPLTRTATIGLKPTELAAKFSNPEYVSVGTPFGTQAECDEHAKALAEQIAGSFSEFEGVARGNPKLRAGKAVSLGLVNKPFDGKYVLTTTRHVYDPKDGYTVWFTVSGKQERSVLGLTGGGGAGGIGQGPPMYGVVPAIVTNNDDPDKLGRVKVKYPWMSDTYESDWARVVQSGGGKNRGWMVLPEVNDEVLVIFEQGDVRRPYVLGGLFNGIDGPNLGKSALVNGGSVQRRAFVSRTGNKLVFFDEPGGDGILLKNGNGTISLALNGKTKKVHIKIQGGDVAVESTGGNVEIKAVNIKIEAQARLELKGTAGVSIDGGPMVEVKGGAVKLN